MEKVKIGQITAPVGIKGEVRVFSYMDEITRFSRMEKLYVGEGTDRYYSIEKVRYDKGMAVIKFAEVPDRNMSETMHGLNLYIPKEEYALEEDRYLNEDIIGSEVFSESGERLGVVNEIIQNSNQDIFSIEKENGKCFLVPAVHEFVIDVDVEKKRIVLHLIEGLLDEV